MRIAEIEDAVLQAVKTSMPYLTFAGNYSGQLDEAQIAEFALNFPAVLIFTEAVEYTHRGWPLLWQDITLRLIVCAENLRDNEAARHGDSGNPGAYEMLEDIFTALFNQTLDIDIQAFDLAREEAVLNISSMAVYMATYKTKAAKN